jgi:hypothetical protein
MRCDRLLRLVVLLVPAFAGGCLQTTYRPFSQPSAQKAEPDSIFERRVDYRLFDAFFTTAPSCAAIVTRASAPRAIARVVEDAVQRHLAMRLPRVMGAARLRRVETALGIDMNEPSDRRVFARQARCDAVVEIHLARVQDDYLVLWAQRRLTIGLTMSRIADGTVLWQARHSTGRADGGLPIAIIDLPVSAARAVMVTSDPELYASIADDAARRMIKTLPDIRDNNAGGPLARH